MRIGIGELALLRLGQLHQLGIDSAGNATALAENHAPNGIVHHHEATLSLLHREEVHQGDVLRVLRERGDQWGIAHARPHILHLVEQLHQHVVHRQHWLALLLAQLVDHGLNAAQVGHHRAHHAARQAAAEQQARHVLVGRIDEVAQPVVYELLRQRACLHIGIHVEVGHFEALVLQHRLYRDDVGMHLTP